MTIHLGCLDGEAFSRGIAFRAVGAGFPLPPLLLEIVVETVEHLGATRDAIDVILGRHADPLDQRPDASDLCSAEFVILQVDVVDDVRDGAQRGVFRHAALQQHFECALVALVGELGLEHVEAQLAETPGDIPCRRRT